jgi:hypothetical protein
MVYICSVSEGEKGLFSTELYEYIDRQTHSFDL